MQSKFTKVIEHVSPSVVMVCTTSDLGSGVVYDANGDIVTNNHVVAGASSVSVLTSQGQESSATVVGTFPEDDLAVVHVSGAKDLKPATWGNSAELVRGDMVLAIGSPLGLASSVTQGIVSALGRTVVEPNGTPIPNTIQTSAPVNPGNSGGALVDLSGNVVGIPTVEATDPQIGGAASGIGFAIPSSTVKNIATQLVKYGTVTKSGRAFLGVTAASIPSTNGALVAGVSSGGPAASAGIARGDVILAVAGHRTADAERLATVLASQKPGNTVKVKVHVPSGNPIPTGTGNTRSGNIRSSGGSTTTVMVTLGQYPG